MEKKFLVEDVFNAVKNCIDNGLFSPLAVMLGMPGETAQTAQETGAFLGKLHSILGVHPTYMDYNIYYALPLPGTALYEYGIQSGFIDGSINGVEEYLESVTNAAAYKRYYMNLTGAPHGEVLSWDWILKLEASRVFRQNQKKTNSFVANKMKEVYKENQRINVKTNPHVKMQYTSMKFTVITRFLDRIVSGNFFFIDRMPRRILYPLVRYVVSFEFMIQTMFKKNRGHYIFKGKARSKKIQRIDVSISNESTRKIGESLRKVVKRNDNEELMTVTEKSRKLLMRGL